LAEYISGNEAAFVKKMNERAQELGMKDTTFKNCHVSLQKDI
jgi:D-alanyl-D-alanine carboxypeptidase (penicillin-binding protein 5/6)